MSVPRLSLSITLAVLAAARPLISLNEVTVQSSHGHETFVFTGASLYETPQRDSRGIKFKIINRTNHGWKDATFTFTLKGHEDSQKPKSSTREFEARIEFIPFRQTVESRIRFPVESTTFEVDDWDIAFDSGIADSEKAEQERLAEEGQRQAQRAKEEAAQRARVRAAREARRKAVAQAPRLYSGSEKAPIAADRKCLQQTLDALQMEGLEKRKRLGELLAYQCIVLAAPMAPVRIDSVDGEFSRVTVIDGSDRDKSGWVLSSWLVRGSP